VCTVLKTNFHIFYIFITGQSAVFRTHRQRTPMIERCFVRPSQSPPLTLQYVVCAPVGQRRQTAELRHRVRPSIFLEYGRKLRKVRQASRPTNLTSSVGSCPLRRKQNDVEARHPAVIADCAASTHSELSVSSPQLATGIPTDAEPQGRSDVLVMWHAEGEGKCIQGLVGKTEGKSKLRMPTLDAIIILKRILKKLKARAWSGFIWLRMETLCGLL